jgi:PAS domain-containing protein
MTTRIETEDVVERLAYIAAILEANADKFAVPDHISAKVRDIRKAADTIERLREENARLRGALGHARCAVASLDDDDLGWSQPPHDEIAPWPLKDELLHTIDAALTPSADDDK